VKLELGGDEPVAQDDEPGGGDTGWTRLAGGVDIVTRGA
jgi:hypothetical protein